MNLEDLFKQEVSLLRNILSNLVSAEKQLENKDIANYQIHIDSHLEMQSQIKRLRDQKAPLLKKERFEDIPVYQEQIETLKIKIRDQKKTNNAILSGLKYGSFPTEQVESEVRKKKLLLEDDVA